MTTEPKCVAIGILCGHGIVSWRCHLLTGVDRIACQSGQKAILDRYLAIHSGINLNVSSGASC